jgi:hypothetical protein
MGRKGQGLRQRIGEAERRQKSAAKRLRRLARRKAKRERPLAVNREIDSGRL